MAPVNLDVVVLEAFSAFLFEELQVVIVREVAKRTVSLLWGVAGGVGSYVVNMHGDRPLFEVVFMRELVSCIGGLKNLLFLS